MIKRSLCKGMVAGEYYRIASEYYRVEDFITG